MSTLDGTVWSKRSIALTCPPGHISSAHRARKNGARVGMNVTAHPEKEKKEETKKAKQGQEKRKRENKRPILKKLCAALLRSFRWQHSEKMKGSARGNWDPAPINSRLNVVVQSPTPVRLVKMAVGLPTAPDTQHVARGDC